MLYLGEIASLLTSVLYSGTALVFTRAGRRVGSATVNMMRMGVALVVMLLLHLALAGSLLPHDAGPARLAWLGISGLIGFALGDALLFETYVQLGPRLGLLIFTTWPVFSALMAWACLGEAMGLAKAAAMVVTLSGIALVVADPDRAAQSPARPRRLSWGLLLGLGAAAGQAIGFILAKVGMTGGFSPVSANVIRVGAGTAALCAWQALRGQLAPNLRKLRDPKASGLILLGSLFGPVIGVVLSLYAINHARYLGVASTLMSLSPVLILPFSVFVEKERVGLRAVAGTVVCVVGAGATFLV